MILSSALITVVIISVLSLLLFIKSFGINREYQRAVLFRLGRLGPMKGPGWYWLIPFIDRVVKVDTRIITYQLETQETITRDGVAVRVNAVLWFRAESPIQVVNSVENWNSATVQAAETALRDAIGQSDLDHMLKDRVSINQRLQQLLREASLKWGVEPANGHMPARLSGDLNSSSGSEAALRRGGPRRRRRSRHNIACPPNCRTLARRNNHGPASARYEEAVCGRRAIERSGDRRARPAQKPWTTFAVPAPRRASAPALPAEDSQPQTRAPGSVQQRLGLRRLPGWSARPTPGFATLARWTPGRCFQSPGPDCAWRTPEPRGCIRRVPRQR